MKNKFGKKHAKVKVAKCQMQSADYCQETISKLPKLHPTKAAKDVKASLQTI